MWYLYCFVTNTDDGSTIRHGVCYSDNAEDPATDIYKQSCAKSGPMEGERVFTQMEPCDTGVLLAIYDYVIEKDM